MAEQQSYGNHARFVPPFHWLAVPLTMIVLVWSANQLVTGFSVATLMQFFSALALTMATFFARVFALKAQDRLIRFEERERMGRLLPDDLKARIGQLGVQQFVSLRFASDGELADLVRRTLAGEFAKPQDIKRAIKTWRADNDRV